MFTNWREFMRTESSSHENRARSLRLLRLIARCGVVGAVLGLSACGGSSGGAGGDSGGVAVRVGGRVISVAAVAHWVPIEAVLAFDEVFPRRSVPVGLVPDPPDYTSCIGYLQRSRSGSASGVRASRSRLKRECAERYATARQHILDILIKYEWLLGEAAERGLSMSDAEAEREMQAHERSQFSSSAAFHRYLSSTGLTMSDELLRFKNNLLARRIVSNVLDAKGLGLQQRRRAYAEFISKWVARTDCSPGYVIADCRQYKGSQPPGS